ncbi:MAG: hypothetical protein ABS62_04435 [Microbacterium sp. SCN 70-200]|uniref:hypothetical protein n=1 Tax=unclassified Microbacterium TaxID=2609290 RepID=UPI00086C23CD|nr:MULTISPECIES: hypothetical protein [unclassified Microbacterium]MBN9215461.1 hypothetical protein [Microbacterium sp.]ODT42012.1 MAG: hypothetical protein ABS62_04435 [Microbacterium sp. SCN 70-200]OJV79497.1 MAG: hypothetical protein BGO46_04085 [Microbacterium sp. 70-16]
MTREQRQADRRARSDRRARRARRARPEVDGSVLRWPGARQRFALFGEVLWVGALMALVSIPIVTWPAPVAAGSAHLRRFVHAEATPASAFFADVRAALPGGLVVGAATTALAALAGVELALLAGGVVPGALAAALVAGAAASVALTLALIAASLWSPADRWLALVRIAPRIARADVSGTAYVIVAVGLAGVVTWQFLPLVIPALGLVAFALVAIAERRLVRLTAAARAVQPA